MTVPIIPGAEPWSHHGAPGAPGALCLHGFTGNPSSMRGVAEAFAAAGFHVELPRLPGHGTTVDDMLTTGWADWSGEAEAAYQRLTVRAAAVVVAGLSMGGSLTLETGRRHPEVKGLVCVNPATMPQPPEVVEMLEDFVAQGIEVMPGIGADIADPDSTETAYEGAPVRPLLSLVAALGELSQVYPTMSVPLLLLTSPQDHVVDPAQSDHLAAAYGGSVVRVMLERSYHVATLDYDRDLINERAVAFARRVTAG
jgi:carboxylesterase